MNARTDRNGEVRLYQPHRELLGWCLFMAVLAGILGHVTFDTYDDGAWVWTVIFGLLTLVTATLYLIVGILWILEED